MQCDEIECLDRTKNLKAPVKRFGHFFKKRETSMGLIPEIFDQIHAIGGWGNYGKAK